MLVEECKDREVVVGVEDSCEEADETIRLNCGWRRGRNFVIDAGTLEGANVVLEREGTDVTILP